MEQKDSWVDRWQGAQERPQMHGSRTLRDLVRSRTGGNSYRKHDVPFESGVGGVGWDKSLRGTIHSSRLASLWGGESNYNGASDNTVFFSFLIGLLRRGSMECGGSSVRHGVVKWVGGEDGGW